MPVAHFAVIETAAKWRSSCKSNCGGRPCPSLLVFVLLLGALCCTSITARALAQSAQEPLHAFDRRPQPWKRYDKPVLSAHTTTQTWCKVVLYSPHVIHHDGKFRMWYLGTSTASRSNDIALGYAESSDGFDWKEHPNNPILTGQDIPWGTLLQTPFVLFDEEEMTYKLWFVSGQGALRDGGGKIIALDQQLGYATSDDGIRWKVHPRPIYASARSPSIIKEGPGKYRMWMNSNPGPTHAWNALYENIYEFTSSNGLRWKRGEKPVVRPSENARTCVYPFVLREGSKHFMWYGCHVAGGKFEIYCSTSVDGHQWKLQHEQVAFPVSDDRDRFDGRYTSTPCVVRTRDLWLLYYSARDWNNEYVRPDGTKGHDNSGVYAHVGVATLAKP